VDQTIEEHFLNHTATRARRPLVKGPRIDVLDPSGRTIQKHAYIHLLAAVATRAHEEDAETLADLT